jgi:hypothetical protein
MIKLSGKECMTKPVYMHMPAGGGTQGGGCGKCVRVHRYTMSKQSGPIPVYMNSACGRSIAGSTPRYSDPTPPARARGQGLTLVHFSA